MLFKPENSKKKVLKIDLLDRKESLRSCMTSRNSDFTDLRTARIERRLSRHP
jgi:hypothetical protein